jgi:hypothetical protein
MNPDPAGLELPESGPFPSRHAGRQLGLRRLLLAILVVEKAAQHAFVTWAFTGGHFGIRESVAVDYRWLAFLGGIAALGFTISLVGVLRDRSWSYGTLMALALVDIGGEFVAQGRIAIALNVSFLVALALLILAAAELRRH